MSLRINPTRTIKRPRSTEQAPTSTAKRAGISETPSSLSSLSNANDAKPPYVPMHKIASSSPPFRTEFRADYFSQRTDENSVALLDQQYCLTAVHLNPNDFAAYRRLGDTLPDNGYIRLINGVLISKQALFFLAIDLNPEHFEAYNSLGHTLPDNDNIRLIDGRLMTKQALFLKAIELNPQAWKAYVNLGNTLSPNGSIQVNGTMMTRDQLNLKADQLR